MTDENGVRESRAALFKESDEIRVNDDAVLAPNAIRGHVGKIVKINHLLNEPPHMSEHLTAVDQFQQLVMQPGETKILGFALQVFFPEVGDTLLVASNEVTLVSKFQERIKDLERRLIAHVTDPQQFRVLGDGGLDIPFINQSFDAPFFGDLVRYVIRPILGRTSTKVLSPESSGPPLASVYASMAGLSFVRAVKVYDKLKPQVPRTWRGTVVGNVKVPSATKNTEHYFAIPEGSIVAGDHVVVFDDVGFTGRTRSACVELVESTGARVSSIVNVVEKAYGTRRDLTLSSKAILGITGFEPESENTCSLKVNELLMQHLDSPRTITGVKYEPERSLSSVLR
jgi:adenine/guanine phosphoribosyltransferase-like PRPP-binding protein